MGVPPEYESDAEHCVAYADELRKDWTWPKYINVYEVTQSFGGPEEGGWWFDCGTPLESVRCDNEQEFDAATLILEKRYEVDEKNRWSRERQAGMHSCMPGAYSVMILVEDKFAEAYPQTCPHYE
jgi:hypothetical protein